MSNGFVLSLSARSGPPTPHNNSKDLYTNPNQLALSGDNKKKSKKVVEFSPVVRVGNSTASRSRCACLSAQAAHVFPRISPSQLAQ